MLLFKWYFTVTLDFALESKCVMAVPEPLLSFKSQIGRAQFS